MFDFVPKANWKDANRLDRMLNLLSTEKCGSAMSGPGWTVLDRFLYRGMRALLFHRDLEILHCKAKNALHRSLEGDADLWRMTRLYGGIYLTMWSLRLRSMGFVLGLNVDAKQPLEWLFAGKALR